MDELNCQYVCGSLVSHKTFVACKIQYTPLLIIRFLFWTAFCGNISRKYYNWKEQKNIKNIQETHVVYSETSQ